MKARDDFSMAGFAGARNELDNVPCWVGLMYSITGEEVKKGQHTYVRSVLAETGGPSGVRSLRRAQRVSALQAQEGGRAPMVEIKEAGGS
jgi:hypothetical protein